MGSLRSILFGAVPVVKIVCFFTSYYLMYECEVYIKNSKD